MSTTLSTMRAPALGVDCSSQHLMGGTSRPTGTHIGPEPDRTVPDFVDVSHHQGEIDWSAYHSSGRTVGVTKATEAGDWVDDHGDQNRHGMEAAGLYCGVYHFAGASGSNKIGNPLVEAQHFLDTVGKLGPKEFPVLDFELPYRMTPAQQVDWIGTWCHKVEDATGKTPWVYTNSRMLGKMDASSLTHYPLWIANYNSSDPAAPPPSGSWPQLTAWQFTDNADTPGITGPTDRSYLYGDLSKLVGPDTPAPPAPPAPPSEPQPTPSGSGSSEPSTPPAPSGTGSPSPTVPPAESEWMLAG